jgi:flagellar motor switch protein FliN/FliY
MEENEDLENTNRKEPTAETGSGQKDHYDIDLILDIPLDISVELGKVKILVNDLLQLGQGSIVDLEKPAGEPLDIYVNAKLVARGEVVVVDEKYGIRIIDVVSPAERVNSLR